MSPSAKYVWEQDIVIWFEWPRPVLQHLERKLDVRCRYPIERLLWRGSLDPRNPILDLPSMWVERLLSRAVKIFLRRVDKR